jgi:hypothetical protein
MKTWLAGKLASQKVFFFRTSYKEVSARKPKILENLKQMQVI